MPDGDGPIESTAVSAGPGPIGQEPAFGLAGQSIEAPGSYFGGRPVGGPSSIFNIGGAPIAVLGGVFSGGLPLGGPFSQIFRSGAPEPPTLYISTVKSSGPIGQDAIGAAGGSLGGFTESGTPIRGFGEGTAPIGELFLEGARSLGEPADGLGGLGGLHLNSLNGTMQRD